MSVSGHPDASFPVAPSPGTPTLKVSNKPDTEGVFLTGNTKSEYHSDNKFLLYLTKRPFLLRWGNLGHKSALWKEETFSQPKTNVRDFHSQMKQVPPFLSLCGSCCLRMPILGHSEFIIHFMSPEGRSPGSPHPVEVRSPYSSL